MGSDLQKFQEKNVKSAIFWSIKKSLGIGMGKSKCKNWTGKRAVWHKFFVTDGGLFVSHLKLWSLMWYRNILSSY